MQTVRENRAGTLLDLTQIDLYNAPNVAALVSEDPGAYQSDFDREKRKEQKETCPSSIQGGAVRLETTEN